LGPGGGGEPRADALGRGLRGRALARRRAPRVQRLDLAQLLAQQRLAGHDLVLTVLRIGVQRTSSSWKMRPAWSGPMSSNGSKPLARSSLWKAASAITCWVTVLRRSRIERGVPAGAKIPNVVCASMPGSPASIEVGISGALLIRLSAFTDRMRS